MNLREAHERPEGMEEASVMMVGLEIERIRQGLAILSTQQRSGTESGLKIVEDYNVTNVSDKVLRIIHSYVDYINRVVWKICKIIKWSIHIVNNYVKMSKLL